ncbi:hypothetical protein B0H13DRAFT_1863033 [Mycena leptocephala]|nr:hypothetical protein B0H13DRAFT_1863033 [Mycena leptocephala]
MLPPAVAVTSIMDADIPRLSWGQAGDQLNMSAGYPASPHLGSQPASSIFEVIAGTSSSVAGYGLGLPLAWGSFFLSVAATLHFATLEAQYSRRVAANSLCF